MAKSTALVTQSRHSVPLGSKLDKYEKQLASAMANGFEEFCKTGVILEKIRDEKAYEDAVYKSFEQYMNERMPCGLKKTQAYAIIKAKNVRPLLPAVSNNSATGGETWTERSIRPLTHSKLKPTDQRRIGKEVAKRVKKGERLTASLVKSICDEELGTEKKKAKKKQKRFKEASLANNLRYSIETVIGLRVGLEMYYEDAWSEVDVEGSGLITALIDELGQLTSFLKE